jgi:hypothetical protein
MSECNHIRVRCTDNRFFCLDCGVEVGEQVAMDKHPSEKQNASEGPKRANKRRKKSEAE